MSRFSPTPSLKRKTDTEHIYPPPQNLTLGLSYQTIEALIILSPPTDLPNRSIPASQFCRIDRPITTPPRGLSFWGPPLRAMLLNDFDDIILGAETRLDVLFHHDRFFALPGHPLASRRMVTRLRHGPRSATTPSGLMMMVPNDFLFDHGLPVAKGAEAEGAENDVENENEAGDRAQDDTHKRAGSRARVQARVGCGDGEDDILLSLGEGIAARV